MATLFTFQDISTDEVKLYTCTDKSYSATVSAVLTDVMCAGEDRLRLCEMEGVTSNLEPPEDLPTIFKPALIKTKYKDEVPKYCPIAIQMAIYFTLSA